MKTYENKKQAIEELKAEGEKELYCVTCYMQDEHKGEKMDLWNIYGNYEDAMRWITLCYIIDVTKPGFEETDYKSFDDFCQVCENYCVKICSYEWKVDDIRNTFIFERVA